MAGAPVREGYMERSDENTWYKIAGAGDGVPLVTVHGGPGGTHDY